MTDRDNKEEYICRDANSHEHRDYNAGNFRSFIFFEVALLNMFESQLELASIFIWKNLILDRQKHLLL